jgi:hypothetical protein
VQGLVDISNVVDEASELVGSNIIGISGVGKSNLELANGVDNVDLVDLDVLLGDSIEVWNVGVVPVVLYGDFGLKEVLLVAVVLPLVGESGGLNEGPLVLPLAVGKRGQEALSSGLDVRSSLLHLVEGDLGHNHVTIGPPGLGGLSESEDYARYCSLHY